MSWLTYGFNTQRTGYNPSESAITTSNAGLLHQLWSVNLGDVMIAQPVEAAGVTIGGVPTNVVYEGTEHGVFYAIDAANGHVIWQKSLGSVLTTCHDMPDEVFGIGGAGTISFTAPGSGVVYVAGGDGSVHALNLATGTEQSGWPVHWVFNPSQMNVYGGLTLFNGNLYVTDASYCDNTPYHGSVTEINVAAHVIVGKFYPAGPPSGGISGGGIWGPGGVSVEPSNGHVFVATGNAFTTPENYLYSDAVVELSPSLGVFGFNKPVLNGSDADFGATPILFRPAGCPVTLAAAKNKTGTLVVYSEGALSSGYRQRLQIAASTGWQFNGIPAWDPVTNMLYIGNSSSSSPYVHGMVALKAAANCTLSLAWQYTAGINWSSVSPPTVANGIVYYGDGPGNTELAFNAATGQELWSSGTAITGNLYAAPTVVNGQLLVPAWNNRLYAFVP